MTQRNEQFVHETANPAIVCEQLIYTSARETLEGQGYGVFGHSPGWPAKIGRSSRQLGEIVAFLPQGATEFVAEGHQPPTCLSYMRRHGGCLVVRKIQLDFDDEGRRANFLVHALWDASGVLTAQNALAMWDSGDFRSVGPDSSRSPGGDLDPVHVVPRTSESDEVLVNGIMDSPMSRHLLETCVAGVLQAHRTERSLVLSTDSIPEAVQWLRVLQQCLPPEIAATTSFTTFSKDPGAVPYQVCVAYPPFSAAASSKANLVDLTSGGVVRMAEKIASETGIARELVAVLARRPHGGGVPEWVRTAADTARWLKVEKSVETGATPTVADLEVLLGPTPSVAWLVDPKPRALIVRVLGADGGGGAVLQRLKRLIDELTVPQRTDLMMAAADELVRVAPEGPEGGHLIALLTSVNDGEQLSLRIARASIARLRPSALAAAMDRLGPYLLESADRLSPPEQFQLAAIPAFVDLALDLPSWQPVHEMLLEVYIVQPGDKLKSAMRDLAVAHPDAFARAIGRQGEVGAPLEQTIRSFVSGSSYAQLDAIVHIALEIGGLRRGFVLHELICNPYVPLDAQRWLLQEHWHAAAGQYGLPYNAARLVKPVRTPIGTAVRARFGGRRGALPMVSALAAGELDDDTVEHEFAEPEPGAHRRDRGNRGLLVLLIALLLLLVLVVGLQVFL